MTIFDKVNEIHIKSNNAGNFESTFIIGTGEKNKKAQITQKGDYNGQR